MKRCIILIVYYLLPRASYLCLAQEEHKGISLSGSIQSDMLLPQDDKDIGAFKDGDFNSNTYADIQLQSRYVDAGARLEYL